MPVFKEMRIVAGAIGGINYEKGIQSGGGMIRRHQVGPRTFTKL